MIEIRDQNRLELETMDQTFKENQTLISQFESVYIEKQKELSDLEIEEKSVLSK